MNNKTTITINKKIQINKNDKHNKIAKTLTKIKNENKI